MSDDYFVASAFFATTLGTLLDYLQVERLILTGISTDRNELSIEQVFSYRILMLQVGGLHSILFVYNASYTCFLHESTNAITGHLYALITKFIGNPGAAIMRLTLPMHTSNVALQVVLILLPSPNRMLTPIVIAAAAGRPVTFSTLHPLNGKFAGLFLYESEYLPSVLEKMLTAFFKMSRSI